MPYNRHGARTANPQTHRTIRTRPMRRRLVGMPLKKKYARTRKDVNKRLTNLRTAVKKLQVSRYGETQLSDQAFYHAADLPVHPENTPYIYDLCSEQPIIWCVQAISEASALWQMKYHPDNAAGTRFEAPLQVGAFRRQEFAYHQLNADPVSDLDTKYRTTEFWKNSLGVQAKYLLKDSYYEFDITCAGCSGFVELCALAHRKNFTRSSSTDYVLPNAMRSYVNTCKGSVDCNVTSQQQTTVRVLKRIYFQYPTPDINAPAIPDPPPNPPRPPPGGLPVQRAQYFNPRRKIFRIKVKSNNVIAVAVATADQTQVIDYTEIPLEQQTFLMLRTSITQREIQTIVPADPPDPADLNAPGLDYTHRLSVQLRRVVKWADYLGNSMN